MTQQNNDTEIEVIHTKIWREDPEPDNPFAAAKCYCAGYDVFGEILKKASWIEYLYLLFKQERPSDREAQLLEKIAIAIANPGIRSHSVRAAMCAGVSGSPSAAALMSSLAVGAGQLGGAREVYLMMRWWEKCDQDIKCWKDMIIKPPANKRISIWSEIEHVPGFDPYGKSCATPVRQMLEEFVCISDKGYLAWLKQNQVNLESLVSYPLACTGVIATALVEMKFTPDEGEMLYLILTLPGAAVHALEQKSMGWRKYPFFRNAIKLTDAENT